MKNKTPIKNIIAESYLLRRSYVSDDLEKSLDNLAKYTTASFTDHRFASGTEFNGWVVPKKWNVIKATIHHKGKLIYDGMHHPLAVITQSDSFEGTVSLNELKKHLYYAPNHPDAIPFHFRLSYRAWQNDWGFCVPKTLFDSLKAGDYVVSLQTEHTMGDMVVREFVIPGKTEEAIMFVAHTDHPGMCNDDLAGCAVGVSLLDEIKKKFPNNHYTYKVLLVQEIMGSVFYLSRLSEKEIKKIKYGLFLEMLGNDNSLNIQKSLQGTTYIDTVSQLALHTVGEETRICEFREAAGNDEIVFEAPGIEIPMPSLSRWPYSEYHTSNDNLELMHEDKLQESLNYLIELVFILENDMMLKRKFTGLVSLANPKYDLYIDPGQILDNTLGQNFRQTNFQYRMPNYLNGEHRISDLALEFGIDFKWLHQYFSKMAEKGLVEFKR
jgi:aminopeptidase-like protein